MIRRHHITIAAALGVAACIPERVSAATQTIMERLIAVGAPAGFNIAVGEVGLSLYVGWIIRIALSLLGVVFFAQMVYAGYLWMTAQGESEQLEKAQHTIRRSIVGLAIVLGAWAITAFVVDRLLIGTGGGAAAPVSGDTTSGAGGGMSNTPPALPDSFNTPLTGSPEPPPTEAPAPLFPPEDAGA